MRENEIARHVVDAAIRIHTRLGPGLFESVYETTMAYELMRRGLAVRTQVALPVVYDSVRLERGFRVDLFVDGRVIVEVKSVEALGPVHVKQLLTYLRLADVRLGLLVNFGALRMKNGIRRVVNGLEE